MFPTSCTTGRKIGIFPSFPSTKKRVNDELAEDDDEIVLSLEKLANSITSVAGRSNGGNSDFGLPVRTKEKNRKRRNLLNNSPHFLPLGKKLPRPRNDASEYFAIVRIFSRLKRGGVRKRKK